MNQPSLKTPFWEQPGRNTTIAAFLMVGIVGGLYFSLGSFASGMFTMFDVISHYKTSDAHLSYIEMLKRIYGRYQIPLLSITVVFEFLFFGGLTAWLFKKWHGLSIKSYFCIKKANSGLVLLSMLGVVSLIPLVNATAELFLRQFPVLKELEGLGNILLTVHSPWQWIFLIFAIGVTPALCEEFLFRGYFHRTLARRVRMPAVFFLSGTVFALIHQNYFGLIALIIVGSYLGFVYQRIGSIFASSAAHFTYNTVLLLMVNIPHLFAGLSDASGNTKGQWILISFLSSTIIILLIWLLTRYEKDGSKKDWPIDHV